MATKPPRFKLVGDKLIETGPPARQTTTAHSDYSDYLHQIKRIAQKIEPTVEAQLSQDRGSSSASDYSNLLSQIDDLIEIAATPGSPIGGICSVNMSTIAEHFVEGFAYRFDLKTSQQVLMLVDPFSPIVAAQSVALIRIFDSVTRAYLAKAATANIEIATRYTAPEKAACNKEELKPSQVVISFTGSSLDLPGQTIEAINSATDVTELSQSFGSIGLELAAGLRIAKRIGGTIALTNPTDTTTVVELTFEFVPRTKIHPAPAFPIDFFFLSKSQPVIDRLKRIADVYKVKAEKVTSPSKATESKKVLFDASEYSRSVFDTLAGVANPENVVVLLPVNDLTIIKDLLPLGYKYFVDYPLVSTALFRALRGYGAYKAPKSAGKGGKTAALNILLVDDCRSNRNPPRMYLESMGHSVTEANDGVEFVKLIEKGKTFDLILCDLTMPHMDGVTALKQARELEQKLGVRTPAVLITTYTELAAEERAQEAGFDKVLRKPLSNKMIAQIISELRL